MDNNMCKDCKHLSEEGSRRTLPHKNLGTDPKRQSKRIKSAMGSADEDYYICRKCGKEWLHETGNMGMGWVS
jgi:hypothetical protein